MGAIENTQRGRGRAAQLVKASSGYTRLAGSIPGQGTHKNQPAMYDSVEQHLNVSLSLSLKPTNKN